jgi:DNA-directed RNA polymerase subunit K/omega
MDDDYEYWDKPEEEYDSDNDVAVSPVNDIIFEDEIEVEEATPDKELTVKITPPIMWDYEKANIIAKRQEEIDKGKKSKIEEEIIRKNITSSYDIANLEFENGKINYVLVRKLDRGFYEKWRHRDFIYFPK